MKVLYYGLVLLFNNIDNTTPFKKFIASDGKNFLFSPESETFEYFTQLQLNQCIFEKVLKKYTNPALINNEMIQRTKKIRKRIKMLFIICYCIHKMTKEESEELYCYLNDLFNSELKLQQEIHTNNLLLVIFDSRHNDNITYCIMQEKLELTKNKINTMVYNKLKIELSTNIQDGISLLDTFGVPINNKYVKESEIGYYDNIIKYSEKINRFSLQILSLYKNKK